MRNAVLFSLMVVLVIGCVTQVGTIGREPTIETVPVMEDKIVLEEKSAGPESLGEMEKPIETMQKSVILAGVTAPYYDFNKAEYDKAIAEGKVIILYFYASWCPICKAEQKDTFAAFNELDLDNVVGFRVNYKDSDTDVDEEALAKQFGITYQHTKVILKDGKRVLKAPDSWDKQRYLTEIMKVA